MGALVAVRQSICMRVVEQRVVAIAPGKFLEGDILTYESTMGEKKSLIFILYHFFIGVRVVGVL